MRSPLHTDTVKKTKITWPIIKSTAATLNIANYIKTSVYFNFYFYLCFIICFYLYFIAPKQKYMFSVYKMHKIDWKYGNTTYRLWEHNWECKKKRCQNKIHSILQMFLSTMFMSFCIKKKIVKFQFCFISNAIRNRDIKLMA